MGCLAEQLVLPTADPGVPGLKGSFPMLVTHFLSLQPPPAPPPPPPRKKKKKKKKKTTQMTWAQLFKTNDVIS